MAVPASSSMTIPTPTSMTILAPASIAIPASASMVVIAPASMAVIPAKAGIHFDLMHQIKMDSRFRGNDSHVGETPLAGCQRFARRCGAGAQATRALSSAIFLKPV